MKKPLKFLSLLFLGLIFSGGFLNAQGTKDSLLQQIHSIRQQGEEIAKSNTYVDLLTTLAENYRYRNADSLIILADEALSIAKKTNYVKGKAFALLRKADYYAEIGKGQEAAELYEQANNLETETDFPKLKVEILKSIAIHEFMVQNHEGTIKASYEGIALASKNKLYELEAELRHNLGYCYSYYELHKEAIEECLIADSLWVKARGIKYNRAPTMANIAINAIEMGDLKLGKDYADKSLAILEVGNDPLWLSRAYKVNANYYLKKQDYNTALAWIKKSDSTIRQLKNPRDQLEINLMRTAILTELDSTNQAKKYALQSLKTAKHLKDSLSQVIAYDLLERLEMPTKNAYSYHEKSEEIKNLLQQNGKMQNIPLLRAKMNFAKEKEILELKSLKKSSEQKRFLHWLLAALVSTIGIIIFVYNANRKKRILNAQLEAKTKKLAENQKILNQINDNQDKLFSIVSHDLRGPIISLRELVDFSLNNTSGDIYFNRFAPKLKADLDHIHFTLDNLLNWGQSQMKGAVTKREIINIKQEIDHINASFSKTLTKKNLTIVNELAEDAKLICDKNHFKIVLRNLIFNAIKFSKENGKIIISTKQKENHSIISIKDNGIGMSKEILQKVFNSPEHYTTFGTNNERGTGIGVKLCKEMLKRNNGTIDVESKVNYGTIVHVQLPKA